MAEIVPDVYARWNENEILIGNELRIMTSLAFPSWLLVRQVGALEVIGAPVIAIIAGMVLALAIRDMSSLSGGIAFT